MSENPYESPNEDERLNPSGASGGVLRSIGIWIAEEALQLVGVVFGMCVGGLLIAIATCGNLWICVPVVVVYEIVLLWLILRLGRWCDASKNHGRNPEDLSL